MNKTVPPAGNPGLSSGELDRLGGKTQLISSVSTPSSSISTPPSANPATPAMVSEFIHPTIMQDLRAFDGVDATFDFEQFDFDLPADLQSQAGQVSREMVDELFRAQPAFGNYPEADPVPQPGPPVLDATWQTFVEQLGF